MKTEDGLVRTGTASRMADAATELLASFSPDQRARAVLDFEDEERENWHYIPRDRTGLSLKEMDSRQRGLTQNLVATGLSSAAFRRASTIIELEPILGEIEGEGRKFARDPGLYFVTLFGTPGGEGTWGWRFEGHHVSLNNTVLDGELISASPVFFGANPAEVRHGAREGLRALKEEEETARALLNDLDGEQRRQAVVARQAPSDILTRAVPHVRGEVKAEGLAGADMNAGQLQQLKDLVAVYVDRLPEAVAALEHGQAGRGRLRKGPLRLGRFGGARTGALLPCAGSGLRGRVRQHAKRRQPHSRGMAGPAERLRGGSPESPLPQGTLILDTVAGAANGGPPVLNPKRRRDMAKTGVVHHNWGGYDLEGFAARAAEIGYRYCELQFRDVWSDGTREGERAAVEVREMLERHGMSVSAVAAGNNFLRADPAQQEAEIERYRKLCEWIPHTGTDVVRSDGGWGEEVPRDQWDGMMLEAFKRCVDFAETSGVRIALDNHGMATNDGEWQVSLIERVGSGRLGVNLDTMNYRWAGWDLERCNRFYELVAPHVFHVHIKDGTGVRGSSTGGKVLG